MCQAGQASLLIIVSVVMTPVSLKCGWCLLASLFAAAIHVASEMHLVLWRSERAYLVLIKAMSTSHYQRLPRTVTLTSTSIFLKDRVLPFMFVLHYPMIVCTALSAFCPNFNHLFYSIICAKHHFFCCGLLYY